MFASQTSYVAEWVGDGLHNLPRRFESFRNCYFFVWQAIEVKAVFLHGFFAFVVAGSL